MPPRDLLDLRIAGLPLQLDARGTGIEMTLPGSHARFLADGPPEGGLVLRVRNAQPAKTDGWQVLYQRRDTWKLCRDEQGRFVLVTPRSSPPRRQVVVDAGFRVGKVIGEFAGGGYQGQAGYPLYGVDIVLFANWLAGFGDLILHACGVELAGAGYAFVGPAGSGKSTLAAAFLSAMTEAAQGATRNLDPSAVLGEDQVILRYRQGRFWIYGTPWHLNPAMCSPRGVPLEKLFFLNRTGAPGMAPVAPLEGTERLLQTAFVPYYRTDALPAILDRLDLLAGQVPFYTLRYQLGKDPIRLIGIA